MRFSRLVSLISLTVFCALGLVVVSSWATRHAIGGGQRFSVGVRNSVLALAEFPTQAKSLIGLFNNYLPPKGVANIYSEYMEVHPLSNGVSGFLLVSSVSSNGASAVSLINLSNRSRRVIEFSIKSDTSGQYSDQLIGSEPRRQSSFSSRHRVWHPYLSKDGTLTYMFPWNDLVTVDLKTGEEKWRVRGAFHHSIEPDANGNLWVCGAIQPESDLNQNPKTRHSNKVFEDQALVKVSPSGKILQSISVADLILNSGLEYLLYGSSNPNVNFDPIHLNQITPILSDSGVFKKGQILVSLRNLSTILLIDPALESVVWHGSGNWMNQHCAKPVGSSTFSVLDNHSFASGEYWLNSAWRTRIVTHNIETGRASEIRVNDESPRDFHIPIEGRALPVSPNHWMIEDCVNGTIMIFGNQKLVFKWSNLYPDGTVGITSWCRYMVSETVPEFLRN
jgi:Arylsulfotransferase (ASST)